MARFEVNFLHIGYHKTASTWFQLYGYNEHPNIFLLNDVNTPYYRSFVKNFVLPDDLNFDLKEFTNSFWIPQASSARRDLNLIGICEENLSGHFWTGRNADTLMGRIKKYFGKTKIIISIREQHKMINSLYVNYVKGGGTLNSRRLLKDVILDGQLIAQKLCYDNFINQAMRLFGNNNVMIYPYEEFLNQPQKVLNKIYDFIGTSEFLPPAKKKPNPGRGLVGIKLERYANIIGLNSKYKRKFIDYLTLGDLKVERHIPVSYYAHMVPLWQKSNIKTKELTGLDLDHWGYIV